ncbi:MAG: chalcone isomerase family protein [Pseudomonas sp.]|uniref:chalcone isomerase family protein n=1 Tax=Pseudomonas sp. TaxID=306 RepID=UPI003D09B76C
MLRPFALIVLLTFSPLLLADNARLREANFPVQHCTEQPCLELKNQSVLVYLWVDVYVAALYTEPGISASKALGERRDKRLELYYLRNIDREDVIKAAWVTLQRQHGKAELDALRSELDALHASFLSIRPKDRYAINYRDERGMSLERNGDVVFKSTNPALADAYLGLWLAPEGLSDDLRTDLLKD